MKIIIQPIFYFMLIAGTISCQSCKEKFECSSGNSVPIPQIMKDFFYFKAGSWWVYYNMKTNAYDSMWVNQSSSNVYRGEGSEGFGKLDKCYEQNRDVISNNTTEAILQFRISNIVVDERERFRFIILWRDTSNNLEKMFELFFTNGELEIIPPLHPIIISPIDTVFVQNAKYTNLIEVDANNYYYDNIKYRLFAKHIGLIKYLDRDSNQWELLKYNIIQ